jgi:hypothetical protein
VLDDHENEAMEGGNNVDIPAKPSSDRHDNQVVRSSPYCVALVDLTCTEAAHFAWVLRCIDTKMIGNEGLKFFSYRFMEQSIYQLAIIYDKFKNAGQLNSSSTFNGLVKGIALRCLGMELMLDVGYVCTNKALLSSVERAHERAISWQQENPCLCLPDYIVGGRVGMDLMMPYSVYSIGPGKEARGLEHNTGCAHADGLHRNKYVNELGKLGCSVGMDGVLTAIQGVLLSLSAVPLPDHCS